MLQFSANVAAEIAAGTARGFICARIVTLGGTVKLSSTSHHSDVTLGGVTYDADNKIVSVEPPKFNSTVDREEYKIVIDPSDFDANSDLVGCFLEVRLGFVNSATGTPYTDLADSLLFYKGRVAGRVAEYDTSDLGSRLHTISGNSPMMALDMTGGIYLSRQAVRAVYADDACCDEIYQGSSALVLKWGRI